MSCPKCIKATPGQIDTLFWCDYCKQRVQATPRCRFQIQLADSTGFITATAFGQQADSMFSISGDYLKNNIKKDTLSRAARRKLGTGIEYAVHLRAYKSAPGDNEFCLFSIDTFVAVTKIIEDTQELHLVLQATTAQKNHYSKGGETRSSATELRASNTATEDAIAAKTSKIAITEDTTAAPKNHYTYNDQ
ncbi:hypothetical protein RHMOL_Rhmol11G0040000 [Rhododendron molle]|uniref:Uncharacterized protein n=1 Tax=Rhododendron molle TaxID=49168 RepID=A0ACC0LNF2_RHOML|nr:hypothetical protein RHMOL_Rhmol11G0040000 [Rhododendron molle]